MTPYTPQPPGLSAKARPANKTSSESNATHALHETKGARFPFGHTDHHGYHGYHGTKPIARGMGPWKVLLCLHGLHAASKLDSVMVASFDAPVPANLCTKSTPD